MPFHGGFHLGREPSITRGGILGPGHTTAHSHACGATRIACSSVEGTAPPPPSRANTHDIGRVKGGRALEPLGSPPSRAEEGGEAKKEEASTSMMFDMDFA